MKKHQYPDHMLTQSALFSTRGWTRGLVKQFAPIPDITEPNPHHRSGCRMKLFLIARIEKTENTTDFVEAMAKAKIRKAAARKAYQTRLKRKQEMIKLVVLHAEPNSTSTHSRPIALSGWGAKF